MSTKIKYNNIWVKVHRSPVINGMSTVDLMAVFGCLNEEISDKLFISYDMMMSRKTKKVYVGWGENLKKAGSVIGFKIKRNGDLMANIIIKEDLSDFAEKSAMVRVDASRDVDTKKIIFNGLLISDFNHGK